MDEQVIALAQLAYNAACDAPPGWERHVLEAARTFDTASLVRSVDWLHAMARFGMHVPDAAVAVLTRAVDEAIGCG